MVLSVGVRNFKSLVEIEDIPFKPLTILVGPNGSGKSSLIQLLLALRQTVDSRDPDKAIVTNGPYVRLGSWEDLISFHDESRELRITLDFSFPYRSTFEKLGVKVGTALRLVTRFSLAQTEIVLSGLEYRDEHGLLFAVERGSYAVYTLNPGRLNMPSKKARALKPYKFYGLSRLLVHEEGDLANVLFRLQWFLERQLLRVFYLGPLREHPQRFYLARGERPQDVGLRGESAAEVVFVSERTNRGLRDVVSTWLACLGVASKIKVVKLQAGHYYLASVDPNTDVEVNLADTGFGVSQVFPIIVQGLYSPNNSLLLVEQPEIHLHPRAQAAIADFLIHVSEKKTVVVETHSESLLTRVQRRVSEGKLDPSRVAVYGFNPGSHGTTVRPLSISAQGFMSELPSGFWQVELEDRLRQLEAIGSTTKEEHRNDCTRNGS